MLFLLTDQQDDLPPSKWEDVNDLLQFVWWELEFIVVSGRIYL